MKEYFEKLYKDGKDNFYKIVEKNLKSKKRMFIVTANPETFSHGEKDNEFNELLIDKDSTLIPDGIGIVKAANMLDYKVKERITGIDLAIKLLEISNDNKYNVALLGAKEEVISSLKKVIKEKYPNINLVKTENGYTEDKDKFFSDIKKKNVDVCLVALGIPHQEKLIYKHIKDFKKGVFVGVGGSFDVMSGTKKRAPKFFQKLNLEWLYRILKEPKRLKRFWDNNVKFLLKIRNMNRTFKNHAFLLVFFYFLIAFINHYYLFHFDIKGYFNIHLFIFTLFWIFIIILLKYIIPKKIGKYLNLLFNVIIVLITIANYFFWGYFQSVFSWKDLMLTGEGVSFISTIFPLITIKIIIMTIVLIYLIIIIFKDKYDKNKLTKENIIRLCIIGSIIVISYIINVFILTTKKEEVFNNINSSIMLENKKNIYSNWNNSVFSLKTCGIYEYLIRDFRITIFSNDNPIKAREYVEKHIDKYKNTNTNNKYYGMFENKNLILVMMESMDDWQVNEISTPTIWMMKNNGIDFKNHHSLHYVTGKTAQSEFMVNTGIYPKFNGLTPHYAYVNNNYKYSLPNLFKEKGYTVNSFHRTLGRIYNRENMMLSLGYEHYYNVYSLTLNENEYDLDRYYALKGYHLFTQKEPFMDFYITFSNHSPYILDKEECKLHYKEMKKAFKDEDDDKLCGYAQAYETDLFFKELIDRLKEDNLLDNTVIIAFSDHPNSYFLHDDEDSKNNYTEMFVYNPKIKHTEINRLTNTINILPMINNLFKLDSPYFMASYDPLSTDESYLIFSDYTHYDEDGYKELTEEEYERINISKNILISDYYNKK